jgi:hypothetical protein
VLRTRIQPVSIPDENNNWLLEVRTFGESGNTTLVVLSPPDAEVRRNMAGQAEANESTLWRGTIPEPARGQPIDYRVLVELADGTSVQWPEGAPRVAASVKRPLARVTTIPTSGMVSDLAYFDDAYWLAVEGGGVRRVQSDLLPHTWTVGSGLPSNVAGQVLADPSAGRVFVATGRGLVGLDSLSRGALRVDIDKDGIWGRPWRVGPAALSPLDGGLLFQVRLERAPPGTDPVFWELRDEKLAAWEHGAGRVDWTAATFDEVDGCYLFGGVRSVPNSAKELVVYERCGSDQRWWGFQPVGVNERILLQRVAALAADPATADIIVAEAARELTDSPPPTTYRMLRLDRESGSFSPLRDGGDRIVEEISGMTADLRRGRLLMSSVGRGVLEIRDGSVQPLLTDERVTRARSVRVDPATGTLLVGTDGGAYLLDERGESPKDLDPSSAAGVPPDALPMDVRREPGDERVLLSSYSKGLFELRRNEGRWAVSRVQVRDVPSSGYGIAVYGSGDEIWAVIGGEGLMKIARQREFPGFSPSAAQKVEGLDSPYVDNLLTLSSGDTWVAQSIRLPPSKNAPGVFGLRGSEVHRIRDVDGLGTVNRWVEERERESVWAATNAGVIEIHPDGSVNRLSGFLAASVMRNPVTGESGNVGTGIEHWDGSRFQGVSFQPRHPRVPSRYSPGAPIDLTISSDKRWAVLYAQGVVALLHPTKELLGLLDWEDGIPSTCVRLLYHPVANETLCGSSEEGLVSFSFGSEN